MINKYSNVPLYSQLKSLILEKIEGGEYSGDSQIPSEQELCEMYNISRPTVRQAIAELTNNGYLYKEKGKGTFVSKLKTRIDIKNYSGFTDSILDCQVPGEKKIISVSQLESEYTKRLEEIFNFPYNQKYSFVEVTYLSNYDSDTIALNVSYLPLNLFPTIIDDIKQKKPSYDILKGKYPLIPVRTKSVLEIVYTDQRDAQYLQIQTGQALIKIDNILYSKSGQVVEYIVSKYRADKCKLTFENSK
ncbi:MAG: GntR family transcriptional regulator [Clostridia bacterium]|nr:GntR family transcriptional regulator [Clostridia bacterium]